MLRLQSCEACNPTQGAVHSERGGVQIVLSRDGRFLAATTFASDVKLWQLEFDRQKAFRACTKAMELKGHSAGVHSIAFNADASRAVTASKDHTLRVWRLDVRCVEALSANAIENDRLCVQLTCKDSSCHARSAFLFACGVMLACRARRYKQQEDPKCLVRAKLVGKPYTRLAWCSNDMIVGATGHELHFISSATCKVSERIPDAHTQPIKGLVASEQAVRCGAVTESIVVSCAADATARIWVVPAAL